MARIGITGHSNISSDSVPQVKEALRTALADYATGELVGVSCLARGADQLFASVVVELGGALEVVLPASDYRERKVKPDDLPEFDALLGKAAQVHTMPFAESGREAYMAASEHVLATIDHLVAVWDGQPSGGYGGTADVVDAAHEHGLPVTVIWPEGARRD